MDPVFFATPADFRAWLEANHSSTPELLVGFHKKGSGIPSLTWPESVEQALRFGWIDGIRRSLGPHSYTIRFTPRRPRSTWSAVNIRIAERLIAQGQMHEGGLRAFQAGREETSRIYSFEQGEIALSADDEAHIAANPAAWNQWQKFPPSYRKQATWWVISAKRPETRSRRLQQLIEDTARGERLAHLRRP
jgi:uncharacterized protein YdeI (YjbR/CyaY-like superfamily)